MKRLLALVLCATASLVALGSSALAITGGASFDSAPLLEAGEQRDTIRPGEVLFYAIDVAEGESFTARVKVNSGSVHRPLPLRLRVYNAQRVEDLFAEDGVLLPPRRVAVLTSVSGRVGPGDPDYPVPGKHYISVSLAGATSIAAEFDLAIEATVREVAAPVPVPQPEERRREPVQAPSQVGRYLVFFLVGALLGVTIILVRAKLAEAPKGLRARL